MDDKDCKQEVLDIISGRAEKSNDNKIKEFLVNNRREDLIPDVYVDPNDREIQNVPQEDVPQRDPEEVNELPNSPETDPGDSSESDSREEIEEPPDVKEEPKDLPDSDEIAQSEITDAFKNVQIARQIIKQERKHQANTAAPRGSELNSPSTSRSFTTLESRYNQPHRSPTITQMSEASENIQIPRQIIKQERLEETPSNNTNTAAPRVSELNSPSTSRSFTTLESRYNQPHRSPTITQMSEASENIQIPRQIIKQERLEETPSNSTNTAAPRVSELNSPSTSRSFTTLESRYNQPHRSPTITQMSEASENIQIPRQIIKQERLEETPSNSTNTAAPRVSELNSPSTSRSFTTLESRYNQPLRRPFTFFQMTEASENIQIPRQIIKEEHLGENQSTNSIFPSLAISGSHMSIAPPNYTIQANTAAPRGSELDLPSTSRFFTALETTFPQMTEAYENIQIPLQDIKEENPLASSSRKAQKTIRTANKKKNMKRRKESLNIHIYRLLKQRHPDMAISNKAMLIMNSFVRDMFQRISDESSRLVNYRKKKTITIRDINSAIKLLLPGNLAQHAMCEATEAINNYNKNKSVPETDDGSHTRLTVQKGTKTLKEINSSLARANN